MKPTFFCDQTKFRKWLEKNHAKKKELLVGYYKVGTKKPSMSWSESVDQALCFGWIDGIRRSVDEKSYCIRFTPRKVTSIWSAINIKKVKELTQKGLMLKAGLELFKKRTGKNLTGYVHGRSEAKLSPELEKQFKTNKKAWVYFQTLAPGYQKLSIHWVMSAKQDITQEKRMKILIKESAAQRNPWKHHKYKK